MFAKTPARFPGSCEIVYDYTDSPHGHQVEEAPVLNALAERLDLLCRQYLHTAVALAALTAACSDNPVQMGCSDVAYYAVSVTVLDSISAAPPAVGVQLSIRDGDYADSLTVKPGTGIASFGLAAERAGSYSVTVDADGYRQWRRDGIVVMRDASVCHVLQTTKLTALLQR